MIRIRCRLWIWRWNWHPSCCASVRSWGFFFLMTTASLCCCPRVFANWAGRFWRFDFSFACLFTLFWPICLCFVACRHVDGVSGMQCSVFFSFKEGPIQWLIGRWLQSEMRNTMFSIVLLQQAKPLYGSAKVSEPTFRERKQLFPSDSLSWHRIVSGLSQKFLRNCHILPKNKILELFYTAALLLWWHF